MTDYKFTVGTYPMQGGGTAEIVHVARNGLLYGYMSGPPAESNSLLPWREDGTYANGPQGAPLPRFDLLPPPPEQRECWVVVFSHDDDERRISPRHTAEQAKYHADDLQLLGWTIHAIKHVTYTDGEGL